MLFWCSNDSTGDDIQNVDLRRSVGKKKLTCFPELINKTDLQNKMIKKVIEEGE